jgi:hypothetical protein
LSIKFKKNIFDSKILSTPQETANGSYNK